MGLAACVNGSAAMAFCLSPIVRRGECWAVFLAFSLLLVSGVEWSTCSPAFAQDDAAGHAFQLQVVGPEGRPVASASVDIRGPTAVTADQIQRGQFVRAGAYGTLVMTDVEGRLALTFPQRPERLSLAIQQAGYGPYWAGWEGAQAVPAEFRAELDAAWSVGGTVVDEHGLPVESAEVRPRIDYKKRPGDTQQLGVGTHILTDAQGTWRFEHVPVSQSDVFVEVSHSGYQAFRQSLPRDGFQVTPNTAEGGRIELKRGLTVTGTVSDESGQPIAGALVRTKFLNDIRETRTDEHGVYRLAGCEPRMARVVVSAQGRAIDMREVRIDPKMDPVDFALQPGGKIRVRVVDEQGQGIPKARIFFQRWRGRFEYFEFDHVHSYTDENGVWQWDEAPLDPFHADICRPEGMQLPKESLHAREEEYVFTPPRALVVSGRVVDGKTKEPIQKFRVIPGLRNLDPRIRMNWISSDSYEAADGTYRVRFTHSYPAHLVRIEADGYQVAISRDIQSGEGEVTYDFELQRAMDIAATIVTAAGKPAAAAKIALGVAGSQISIDNGDLDDGSTFATRLDADAEGHFSLPARNEPFQLVITHPAGFAYVTSNEGPVPDRIVLVPWARAEGVFRVGTQPMPNVILELYGGGIHSYGADVPNIFTHDNVTTGEGGRFVFDRVFPGHRRIGRRILLMVNEGAVEVTSSLRVPAEFVAGETTTVHLGGTGRTVVGALAPPADHEGKVLWNFALIHVRADWSPPPDPTPANVQNDPQRRKAWWDAWRVTAAGRAWTFANETYERLLRESPYITASVDRDGSFRLDDVPAGAYVLSIDFSQHEAGVLQGYRFSVPPSEGTNEPLDLGTLMLDKR